MPYCSKCGVEVDDFVERCPLCNTPIQKFSGEEAAPPGYYPGEKYQVSAEKKTVDRHSLYFIWMIVTVVLFTPFFVILTINFQYKGMNTWAGYTLSSIIAAWICSSLLIFFIKKPFIFSTGIMVTIGVLLYFFNILYGKLTWFFPVGLPILVMFYFLSLAVVILSVRIKDKGLNIGAFILIASGIFCLGLDILLAGFLSGKYVPGWSFIVISAFFPLALFFLIVHYILKKRVKFKRVFHI